MDLKEHWKENGKQRRTGHLHELTVRQVPLVTSILLLQTGVVWPHQENYRPVCLSVCDAVHCG